MVLNCDLGEGESPAVGRALMRVIQAANIACGGHAGDAASMQRYVRWCRDYSVLVGAHPGPWNRADLGRGETGIRPSDLELLLLHQVGALSRIADAVGVPLHHIKLHGALYHASEKSPAMARAYVEVVPRWWPNVRLIVLAGGRVAEVARRAGLPIWEEAFADRAYADAHSLVPRGTPGALLNLKAAVAQARLLIQEGQVRAVGGKIHGLRAQTLCVHSDTRDAQAIASTVRKLAARTAENKR